MRPSLLSTRRLSKSLVPYALPFSCNFGDGNRKSDIEAVYTPRVCSSHRPSSALVHTSRLVMRGMAVGGKAYVTDGLNVEPY